MFVNQYCAIPRGAFLRADSASDYFDQSVFRNISAELQAVWVA
jgi:hypothetical protein